MRQPAARSAPILFALLLSGCTMSSGSSASSTSSNSPASPAAQAPSPTSAATPSPTPSASSPSSQTSTVTVTVTKGTSTATATTAFPVSQQRYTSALVRAWGVGNRTLAARYAGPAAVRRIFAIGSGGPNWALIVCDNAGPRPACTFGNPGQGQRLVLFYDANRLGHPQAVVDAQFIADDPSAPVQ